MQAFLDHCSKRPGFDGWALFQPGSDLPVFWSVSTTREEVREIQRARPHLFGTYRIEKVRIRLEAVLSPSTAPPGAA